MEQALDPATPAGARSPGEAFDEAFAGDEPRPHYRAVLEAFAACDLVKLGGSVRSAVAALGMEFRTGAIPQPFPVDPVPRIIAPDEWDCLRRGLAQRTRALDAFLADVHAERRIVSAGVVPERVLTGIGDREPDMRAVAAAGGARAHIAGFDVVRDADGSLRVLEDNLRTPSGLAYIDGARAAADGCLPIAAPPAREPLRHVELLAATLRAAAPEGAGGDPAVILLSDGPSNSAWWEHTRLARALGIPLVTPERMGCRGGRVLADGSPVDVIYRRTDEERLRDEHGRLTWVGALLLDPLERGRVACVNGFGTGVADDKLVHAYVEDMVRFYLGEEPAIRSVATYDPGDGRVRGELLARIGELVLKPRAGAGGAGVIVCPHASPRDVARAAELIRTRPDEHVVQETIALSTHPTVIDGALAPRHVDLRVFAFHTGDSVEVLAGGLTRVALDEGALVVNSSRNGGGKDTWMLR